MQNQQSYSNAAAHNYKTFNPCLSNQHIQHTLRDDSRPNTSTLSLAGRNFGDWVPSSVKRKTCTSLLPLPSEDLYPDKKSMYDSYVKKLFCVNSEALINAMENNVNSNELDTSSQGLTNCNEEHSLQCPQVQSQQPNCSQGDSKTHKDILKGRVNLINKPATFAPRNCLLPSATVGHNMPPNEMKDFTDSNKALSSLPLSPPCNPCVNLDNSVNNSHSDTKKSNLLTMSNDDMGKAKGRKRKMAGTVTESKGGSSSFVKRPGCNINELPSLLDWLPPTVRYPPAYIRPVCVVAPSFVRSVVTTGPDFKAISSTHPLLVKPTYSLGPLVKPRLYTDPVIKRIYVSGPPAGPAIVKHLTKKSNRIAKSKKHEGIVKGVEQFLKTHYIIGSTNRMTPIIEVYWFLQTTKCCSFNSWFGFSDIVFNHLGYTNYGNKNYKNKNYKNRKKYILQATPCTRRSKRFHENMIPLVDDMVAVVEMVEEMVNRVITRKEHSLQCPQVQSQQPTRKEHSLQCPQVQSQQPNCSQGDSNTHTDIIKGCVNLIKSLPSAPRKGLLPSATDGHNMPPNDLKDFTDSNKALSSLPLSLPCKLHSCVNLDNSVNNSHSDAKKELSSTAQNDANSYISGPPAGPAIIKQMTKKRKFRINRRGKSKKRKEIVKGVEQFLKTHYIIGSTNRMTPIIEVYWLFQTTECCSFNSWFEFSYIVFSHFGYTNYGNKNNKISRKRYILQATPCTPTSKDYHDNIIPLVDDMVVVVAMVEEMVNRVIPS